MALTQETVFRTNYSLPNKKSRGEIPMGEKKKIRIAVKDKIACLVDKEQFLVCGNNDYEVVFDFDSDWEGISAKTAVFVYGDTPIHQPFTGDICKGVEIKNATLCAIGVFAGNIKTTTGATIECRQSIRDLGGVPKPPSKEVYDEIMALLDKAIEAHTELPVGGKTGQILKKRSDEDYDTYWADEEKEDLSVFVKNEDFEIATNEVDKKISDLDFRVSTLENLTLQYISDKSVSYKKDVPINSGDHATLRSIGGMTYIDETKNTLVDAKVTELKAHGANLIPFPYKNTSKTEKGVTYTVNEDGTVVLNGTSTAKNAFSIAIFSNLTAGKRCTLSGCPSGGSVDSTYAIYVSEFLNGVWQNEFFDKGSSVSFTAQEGFIYQVYISIWKEGVQFNNLTFKPMLNYGSTAAPYKPYRADAVDTFPIPAELIAFLEQYGYGCGVNANYHNYIDYERKVFVQKTKRIVFNGTENWELQSINSVGLANFMLWFTPKAENMQIICSHYDTKDSLIADAREEGVMNNPNLLFVRSFVYQTVDEWKAHLAELYANGNPLVIEYALAEPIETDISDYINNNIIKVTAGGAIEFVNEHKFAVPSEIVYVARKE